MQDSFKGFRLETETGMATTSALGTSVYAWWTAGFACPFHQLVNEKMPVTMYSVQHYLFYSWCKQRDSNLLSVNQFWHNLVFNLLCPLPVMVMFSGAMLSSLYYLSCPADTLFDYQPHLSLCLLWPRVWLHNFASLCDGKGYQYQNWEVLTKVAKTLKLLEHSLPNILASRFIYLYVVVISCQCHHQED